MSAATAGNGYRLGANEAPPAIISVFLGDQLTDVVEQLVETGRATHSISGSVLDTGVSTVPNFKKDVTDRNRTSPFAFTGNKFEFRMVGSSQSIARPNTVLNTIVAETLSEAADILEKADDFDTALHDLIKDWFTQHSRIIFNGDGYSEEWVQEAARRGLPNISNTVDAIQYYTDENYIRMFEKHGVLSRTELQARQEVEYECYSKEINIESRTMVTMARKQIIPAVIGYKKSLAEAVITDREAGADVTVEQDMLRSVGTYLSGLCKSVDDLENATNKAIVIEDKKQQAAAYRDTVRPVFTAVRENADALERIVDREVWPFPTYDEILFNV